MKLATLKNNTRDGQLVIVSRDLTTCIAASPIADTLQGAIDNWDAVAPKLQAVYDDLNAGKIDNALPFDEATCESRYRAPINGQMALPTSTMLSWCAKHAMRNCLRASGAIP